jgi:uncharacterized membrane protein
MTKNNSVGEELYSDASTFGRIEGWIVAIITTIIGLIFIIGGIIMIAHHTTFTNNVQGTVLNANCINFTGDNNTQEYSCTLNIEYEVNGKTYQITTAKDSVYNYTKGNDITVYYDPKNPQNGKLNNDNHKVLGIIALVAGILIPLFAWIWLWITYKSKFAAASGGVAGAFNLLK